MSSDNLTTSSSSSTFTPIRRLLVANRGEIARRIFRSAHDLGIETVAVFADGDSGEPFVAEAHQGVSLRGRTPDESYLDANKVIDAARVSGADAVHPGYGFLAENAEFAQAVLDSGLIWVGPTPQAIASMGDKLAAKAIMAEAGVPMLPSIAVTDDLDVISAAGEIGYPLLVKATAGGGGKGMRVVESAETVVAAVASAQREAASSFGNGVVFLEKFVTAGRHIEIQVMGDAHGELVHLYERECSIQRRHQKIIEEAPSSVLDGSVRSAMAEAALVAAHAIRYSSAGTVEFLVEGQGSAAKFWFLEMNTRIQVEHPVTEAVTGIDLVREQLLVAGGASLSFAQSDLKMTGHAIEARLYAEDPSNDFMPAIGTLYAFGTPESPQARIDSGVEAESVIGVDFDPMLAKVIVHAPTRIEAARRLALVLDKMTIAGVTTNRDFLVSTLRHEAFLAGDTTTDFIERVQPRAMFEPDHEALMQAARAAVLFTREVGSDTTSPLSFMPRGYRNSSMPAESASYSYRDQIVQVHYRPSREGGCLFEGTVDAPLSGSKVSVSMIDFDPTSGSMTLETDGLRSHCHVVPTEGALVVQTHAGTVELGLVPTFPDHSAVEVSGGQTAPMPGKILAVHVVAGDHVSAGQALVTMEAMKLEQTVSAPRPSTVSELRCSVGDQVDNGQVLVVLQAVDAED